MRKFNPIFSKAAYPVHERAKNELNIVQSTKPISCDFLPPTPLMGVPQARAGHSISRGTRKITERKQRGGDPHKRDSAGATIMSSCDLSLVTWWHIDWILQVSAQVFIQRLLDSVSQGLAGEPSHFRKSRPYACPRDAKVSHEVAS